MGQQTKIEWADHTFNPWRGCTKISTGCANCYADSQAKRNPKTLGIWGPNGTRVVASEAMWQQPVKWNNDRHLCGKCGRWNHPSLNLCSNSKCSASWDDFIVRRPRVFCASMADVFEDWGGPVSNPKGDLLLVDRMGAWRPESDNITGRPWEPMQLSDVRARLFTLIEETTNLDWLLLTKRPENIRKMWPSRCVVCDDHECGSHPTTDWGKGLFRKNVWLGTSISCQEDADRNIPELLKCRHLSPVLFLSLEPLVGPVDLSAIGNCESVHLEGANRPLLRLDPLRGVTDPRVELAGADSLPRVDWVIVGGESGPNARPMHPDWVRSIRDQCQAAGVPFFFKQWGEYLTFEQVTTREQGKLFCDATRAGEQSYFGARIVPTAKGLKTSTTSGVRPASYAKLGKTAAGRLLDCREWNGFPEVKR